MANIVTSLMNPLFHKELNYVFEPNESPVKLIQHFRKVQNKLTTPSDDIDTKLDIFAKSLDTETSEMLLEAKAEAEEEYCCVNAILQENDETDASFQRRTREFTTPTQKTVVRVPKNADDYTLDMDNILNRLVSKRQGHHMHLLLQDHLSKPFSITDDTIRTFNKNFKILAELADGPVQCEYSSQLKNSYLTALPETVSKKLEAKVGTSSLSALMVGARTLVDTARAVQTRARQRSNNQGGGINAVRQLFPQGDASGVENQQLFPTNPSADAQTKSVIAALNAAASPFLNAHNMIGKTLSEKAGDISTDDFSQFEKGLKEATRSAKTHQQLTQSISAISNMLPTRYFKTTRHNTEQRFEYDLAGESEQDLKSRHKKLKKVLRYKRGRSDQDDVESSSEEDEEQSPKQASRKSKRLKGSSHTVAALQQQHETRVAEQSFKDILEGVNNLSREMQQLKNANQNRPNQGQDGHQNQNNVQPPNRGNYQNNAQPPNRGNNQNGRPYNGRPCQRCRAQTHHVSDCPQRDTRKCYNCKKEGHISYYCPTAVCTDCEGTGHMKGAFKCPKKNLN